MYLSLFILFMVGFIGFLLWRSGRLGPLMGRLFSVRMRNVESTIEKLEQETAAQIKHRGDLARILAAKHKLIEVNQTNARLNKSIADARDGIVSWPAGVPHPEIKLDNPAKKK